MALECIRCEHALQPRPTPAGASSLRHRRRPDPPGPRPGHYSRRGRTPGRVARLSGRRSPPARPASSGPARAVGISPGLHQPRSLAPPRTLARIRVRGSTPGRSLCGRATADRHPLGHSGHPPPPHTGGASLRRLGRRGRCRPPGGRRLGPGLAGRDTGRPTPAGSQPLPPGLRVAGTRLQPLAARTPPAGRGADGYRVKVKAPWGLHFLCAAAAPRLLLDCRRAIQACRFDRLGWRPLPAYQCTSHTSQSLRS